MGESQIALFEKIPFEQWEKDLADSSSLLDTNSTYENIQYPNRATKGSAGYDFYVPYDIVLSPGAEVVIQSGIRVKIATGYVLMLFPRSSMGFKYGLQLSNTVGIIDSDYYNADNYGHIMFKVRNTGSKVLSLMVGDRFAQGVFVPYGITLDDKAVADRTGGIGSTGE